MFLDSDIAQLEWIRDRDDIGAVMLARRVLLAEAGAHRLPIDSFDMSGRVRQGDGGVDGTSDFASDSGVLLPCGSQVWQVKSGTTPPRVDREFDATRHRDLFDAIADGADYVLFWTFDAVNPVRQRVTKAFAARVREIRPDAKVTLLCAGDIQRLCLRHPAILADVPVFGPLANMQRWGSRFIEPFVADEARLGTIRTIRHHVQAAEPDSATLHVVGDRGVGKRRLVYEALDIDGLRERVLVADDHNPLAAMDLIRFVKDREESLAVLVVPEADAKVRLVLHDAVFDLGERLRLVTTGPLGTRETTTDSRYVELGAHTGDICKAIASAVGLGEEDAALVAAYTEGFPGLARRVALAVHLGTPASLGELLRADETVGVVLGSMLSPDEVRMLGLLGLFPQLGWDGAAAVELEEAAAALRLSVRRVRRLVNLEVGRFVIATGPYRVLIPPLFAVWAAMALLEDIELEWLRDLPRLLRRRLVDQLGPHCAASLVAEAVDLVRDTLDEPDA